MKTAIILYLMSMNNITKVQLLLLKWIRHHNETSTDQIREACKRLMSTFELNPQKSLFKLLYPLLSKGLIDFSENGKYKPCAPIILYYTHNQVAVAVNLYDYQKNIIYKITKNLRVDDFGLIRFKCSRNEAISLSKKIDCIYSEPKVVETLRHFPKIIDVVSKQFEKTHLDSTGEYYDIKNHIWKRNTSSKKGIYRLDVGAQKFYLRTNEYDFTIPHQKQNPEGRPLAETFHAIKENIDFFQYNKNHKTLNILYIKIPILLDRQLRIQSLFLEEGVKENGNKTCYSNITPTLYNQIIRIFENKNIYYE